MLKQQSFEVILVGKSILLREGIAEILRAAKFRIVASVFNADDLRPSKAKLHRPLFLIVHTGDGFDIALEQIALCRDRHVDARVAIVADRYRMNEVASAFHAGANGYFVDIVTCDRFIRSIELVMMGETIVPLAFLTFILDATRQHPVEAAASVRNDEPILVTRDATPHLLSPQEKVILHCIIQGDSNKCIGRKIDAAEATVKVHVKTILRKIRVQNRTQAAVWGLNNRFHTQPEVGGSLVLPSATGAKIASSIPTDHPRKG